MNNVYKKCDVFEKERLDFFVQKFVKMHAMLNIYEKMNVGEIYAEFLATARQTNPDRDLVSWSKDCGAGMSMNWPVFEEYSEELKTIARGSKAKSIKDGVNVDNNGGVLMTSIKHKGDEADFDTNRASVISSSANENLQRPTEPKQHQQPQTHNSTNYHQQQSTTNSLGKESANPFGDYNDDDDNLETNRSNENNNDSDDDSSNPPNYLNVKVKALYDYQSAEDDELSFKAGEEFTKLMNEDERGWCLGKIGSKIGLYPATYAESI